jgi:LSD1 subclass zinc finger protein
VARIWRFVDFRLALVAAVLVAVLVPPAASAGSLLGLDNNCGATSQPFAQFGDSRNYTFGTNGGLESGANGWTVSGGRVVSGNESYYVHSKSDRNSLQLPAGASAATPALCQSTTSTVVRFFLRSPDNGSVRVQIVARNLLGQVLGVLDVARVSPGASWQPGPAILNLQSLLGLIGVSSIQIKFVTVSGTVQVDDVYVDPWGSRGC